MKFRRILNPLERFSEIVFGLIMVLSITCAISVAEGSREGLRTMLVSAIGCNLAWGAIDAAFYLIACLTEQGRSATFLRRIRSAATPSQAHQIIAHNLLPPIAEVLQAPEFERIRQHLEQLPETSKPVRLTAENCLGALGVFLLVFISTFPVVVPFVFIGDIRLALRISNAIAIALLFAAGWVLAGYAGLHRTYTGMAMVAIGATLVALTIALGA